MDLVIKIYRELVLRLHEKQSNARANLPYSASTRSRTLPSGLFTAFRNCAGQENKTFSQTKRTEQDRFRKKPSKRNSYENQRPLRERTCQSYLLHPGVATGTLQVILYNHYTVKICKHFQEQRLQPAIQAIMCTIEQVASVHERECYVRI